jgi:glycosyltransferase involved in cell wall biosynthesis
MRIAIDARELGGKPTGVGRYLWQLLLAWNEMPAAAAHEFVLCSDEPAGSGKAGPAGATDAELPNLRIRHRQGRFRGPLWEQFSLPLLASDANVLFAPAYSGPLAIGVPMVLTIHDVSFAAHPEWFAWREGLRRRLITRASAKRAARILTVSDFSKREIVRRLGVYPDKVEVVYSGVHQVIPTGGPPGTARSAVPDSHPLVLFVGSIFNRRHIPELIQGFALLARRHPGARLTIVGDNRTLPRVDLPALVAQSQVAERVRVREYVSDEELASLYGEASALAFLSDYEGFGFTPLEALAVGVPPVVLDTEVAREIYGPSAAYVARPEPALIAAALETVLTDHAERQRILTAAPRVLARYSWRECAHRTLQVLLACAT